MGLQSWSRQRAVAAVAAVAALVGAPAALAETDLLVLSVVGPTSVRVGATETWTVSAAGNGDPVTGSLIVNLPPQVELVSFAAQPGALAPQCGGVLTITCTIPGLGGGASTMLVVRLKGVTAGRGSIRASIATLDATEANLGNNQAGADVIVSRPVASSSTAAPKCSSLADKKARLRCAKAVARCVRIADAKPPRQRASALGSCYRKVREDHGVR